MDRKLILICDNEAGIHESLRLYLERDGFDVRSVYRGDAVMDAFFSLAPDLVILDIMMPGRSGTDVCADIRKTSSVPIIMLTAKGEEVDRLLGFKLGADDYIVKPFSPREVVSRIHVIFRRLESLKEGRGVLTVGNTAVDIKSYDVSCEGTRIVLSPKEVEILHALASHPRQVFTREQLLDSIWGYDFDGDTRVVDTAIKRIRRKMPETSSLSIKSVYGVGYKAEIL